MNSPADYHAQPTLMDIVYVGFNSRVVALHRDTGEILWDWESPKGSGFAAILIDGDRLIVSIEGYTYCLDAIDGALLWSNPLKGFGLGIPSLASLRGNTGSVAAAAVIAQQQSQQQQTAAHSNTTLH